MMVEFKELKLFLLFVPFLTYVLSNYDEPELSDQCGEKSCLYHRLVGFPVGAWTNLHLHACARLCSSDRRCASFNYKHDYGTCEMVSKTVRTVNPYYILGDIYWHHFDLVQWFHTIPVSLRDNWLNGQHRCDDSICTNSDRCIASRNTHGCLTNPPRCPGGYIQLNKKCYLFQAYPKMTWDDTMAYCQSIGATLGTIRSWPESYYIFEYLRGISEAEHWHHSVWMGIKYNVSGDGIWTYQPDGEPVDSAFIAHWTSEDTDHVDDQCGYMLNTAGPGELAWNASNCSIFGSFICEKALDI